MTPIDPFGFICRPDHHAYIVPLGRLDQATTLMVKLGFICFKEQVTEWGVIRNFTPIFSGLPYVQLIEDYGVKPRVQLDDTPHLGLAVSRATALEAATAVMAWARENGVGRGSMLEPADDTKEKIFVYLPDLLHSPLEFVETHEHQGI